MSLPKDELVEGHLELGEGSLVLQRHILRSIIRTSGGMPIMSQGLWRAGVDDANVTLRKWYLESGAAQGVVDGPGVSRKSRCRSLDRVQRGPYQQLEIQGGLAEADQPHLRTSHGVVGQRERQRLCRGND